MPNKAMDFLAKPPKQKSPPALVIFGDDDFLRREALLVARHWVLGEDVNDFNFSNHEGPNLLLASLLDELRTPPFLGERRLVVVEEADKFISEHRTALERYLDAPSSCAVLLLLPVSWPSNTKLYKRIEETGRSVECVSPKPWLVSDWCVKWAKSRYQKNLAPDAAQWLVELVGPALGQLNQELSKLTSFVGEATDINVDDINKLVAGTRTDTIFKLLDMILDGNLKKSLELLDRLFVSGESPVAILAMMTAQLRRLARAARETQLGLSTQEALQRAGMPPFAIEKARSQMNHLGRATLDNLYQRLLEADLGLKGSSGMPPRMLIESLLIKLAQP